MGLPDRIGRSLFVALALGLAWGIRGDFGHVIGAMYPGAVLFLALAHVSGQRGAFLWMPALSALSAAAIGAGGTMSYGILHGYAQSDTFLNYAYGFLTLFLQGGAWGTFGGALIGLLMERRPMRTGEWLGLLGSVFVGGWLFSFVLVNVLGFQINPPRNNTSVGFIGASLCQFAWLSRNDRRTGLRGALLGFLGFGLGMATGRMLGNLSNVLQDVFGLTINHWNVMEVSCGAIGGFIFAFGMVDREFPEPPEDEGLPFASFLGMIIVLGVVPLWHRLARVETSAKLAEWAKALKEYGHADPEGLASMTLTLMNGVCLMAFVGVGAWAFFHFRRRVRTACLPVFWLSLTMLLLQNMNALYFFYPTKTKTINMHNVFWVFFALMVVHAVLYRIRPVIADDARRDDWPPWGRWLIVSFATLTLVVGLSGLINGPKTMATANTRWPIWNWREGPFPGTAPVTR